MNFIIPTIFVIQTLTMTFAEKSVGCNKKVFINAKQSVLWAFVVANTLTHYYSHYIVHNRVRAFKTQYEAFVAIYGNGGGFNNETLPDFNIVRIYYTDIMKECHDELSS